MQKMSRDKVEHYLLTTAFLMSGMSSSSFNILNATWNLEKRTLMDAERTASRFQNNKLM
jgi:hypothetical protein